MIRLGLFMSVYRNKFPSRVRNSKINKYAIATLRISSGIIILDE